MHIAVKLVHIEKAQVAFGPTLGGARNSCSGKCQRGVEEWSLAMPSAMCSPNSWEMVSSAANMGPSGVSRGVMSASIKVWFWP